MSKPNVKFYIISLHSSWKIGKFFRWILSWRAGYMPRLAFCRLRSDGCPLHRRFSSINFCHLPIVASDHPLVLFTWWCRLSNEFLVFLFFNVLESCLVSSLFPNNCHPSAKRVRKFLCSFSNYHSSSFIQFLKIICFQFLWSFPPSFQY